MQREHLEEARAAAAAGRPGYRSRDIGQLDGPNTVLREGAGEVLEGMRVDGSHGHVPGMQLVWLEDGGERLVFASDLIPTLSHLRLAGSGETDADPDRLEIEKRKLIEEALRRRGWIFLYHDPRHVAVRVGGSPERPFASEEVLS